MNILIAIIFITTFILFVIYLGIYASHVTETKQEKEWGWGNFTKFKEQWDKNKMELNWASRGFFASKLSSDYSEVQYLTSGSKIMFNGKGMVLGPIDYLRSQIFLKKELVGKNSGKW